MPLFSKKKKNKNLKLHKRKIKIWKTAKGEHLEKI